MHIRVKHQNTDFQFKRLTVAITLVVVGILSKAQAEFLPLGDLPGGDVKSIAWGISADGSAVVGESDSVSSVNSEAFLWTQAGGMVGLGDLPGSHFNSFANDVNADGTVVVGASVASPDRLAFRWTSAGGMVSLGDLPGGAQVSVAHAVSADGSVVVGEGNTFWGQEAFRWTQAGGMVGLGDLPGGARQSYAYGVSADGEVVIGYSQSVNGLEAFRWTQAGGMVGLGDLPGSSFSSRAYGVSADGEVVVGYSQSVNGSEAFRWTQAGGMQGLGDLTGGFFLSVAYAASVDGTVVVGYSDSTIGNEAFRWTSSTGMQTVSEWLTNAGVAVAPGFTMQFASDVSSDGNVVVGYGQNASGDVEAFLARAGNPSGSGAISLNDLSQSLAETGNSNDLVLTVGDLILNGAHSRPLSRRVNRGQNCTWIAGDWGKDNHGSRDGDIQLAEVGGCHNFGSFQANFSAGKTWADQNLSQNGDIDIQSNYIMGETLVPLMSQLWASFGALYQWGEADIRRGYLNAGLPDWSSGSSNFDFWAVRARLDWDGAAQFGSASISPYADLSYREMHQDRYTETGGGFPARFDGNITDATELRLGVNVTKPLETNTRLLGQLEGVHRFDDNGNSVSGNVIGLFGFNFTSQDADQDWLRGGLGVEHDTTNGRFSLMINATTEGEESNAWLAASYQASF